MPLQLPGTICKGRSRASYSRSSGHTVPSAPRGRCPTFLRPGEPWPPPYSSRAVMPRLPTPENSMHVQLKFSCYRTALV